MNPSRPTFVLLVLATLAGSPAGATAHRPSDMPWSDVVRVPGFDPKLGELGAVRLTIDAFVRTEMRAENLGAGPEMVSANAFTRVNVQLPGGAPIADVPFDVSEVWVLDTFDGAHDFDGVSGRTARDSCRRTVKLLLTEPSDLSLFVGAVNDPGSVGFAVGAVGMTDIVGGTAVTYDSRLEAGVRVGVEYVVVAPN